LGDESIVQVLDSDNALKRGLAFGREKAYIAG
jgi:hypothetical protein